MTARFSFPALITATFFGLVSLGNAWADGKVDPNLPVYKPAPGLSGQIKSVGSDSMNSLMTQWTEKFKQYYKGVRTEVEGQGSSKAMPALIEGAASFGPMSRDAKANEIADFEKKYGYKPVLLPTSIDLLAVYVNRDNPLQSLSMEQVDAIFSSTRKLGSESIDNWGQVGLKGDYEKEAIALFGRNAASGTYGFFKEKAMGNGDFRDKVNEQPGSTAVIASVGENRFAMGYSGIGYKTEAVKALALAPKKGEPAIEPTEENAYNGKYPLGRYLFLAVNYKPTSKLEPLRKEFIKFIFSKEGQEIAVKDGYFPVDAKTAAKALKMVGIDP
ncbi:MAG: phosphate ABC transporter substrate-binding protein PstS family protein [Planctomycetota bacterium]|nr:phosphate ABC transporter substrate-binding protein PstS family protein [Planctomycetota bacterium]